MEIPASIFDEKAKNDIKNGILRYASDNNIPIDKLCNIMSTICLDFERQKSEYYSKIVCQLLDTVNKSFNDNVEEFKKNGTIVKEVNSDGIDENVQQDKLG